MRVLWTLLAGLICLMLASCPKDLEETTPEGVDQAGMKQPEAFSDGEKAADEAIPGDQSTPDPPAEGGEAAPPAEGGEAAPPAEGGEAAPPAEGGEAAPPAEGG